LTKVFRVLKKLEAGDSTSAAAFAQIKQLAQNNSEFPAFARELFDLDEKTNPNFDFADYDESGSVVPKLERDQDPASWLNVSPAQTTGESNTVWQCKCFLSRRPSLTIIVAAIIERE
jgi:hypothetical protein